jgi:hypothetical protein
LGCGGGHLPFTTTTATAMGTSTRCHLHHCLHHSRPRPLSPPLTTTITTTHDYDSTTTHRHHDHNRHVDQVRDAGGECEHHTSSHARLGAQQQATVGGATVPAWGDELWSTRGRELVSAQQHTHPPTHLPTSTDCLTDRLKRLDLTDRVCASEFARLPQMQLNISCAQKKKNVQRFCVCDMGLRSSVNMCVVFLFATTMTPFG